MQVRLPLTNSSSAEFIRLRPSTIGRENLLLRFTVTASARQPIQ